MNGKDFKDLQSRGKDIREWLVAELSRIRTGRATSALIDHIYIEVYGSNTPIAHIASITTEDPKTLRVAPYDKAHIKNIQTAIDKANLGVGTAPDGIGVRIIFPALTEETRKNLAKLIKEKLEKAKVSLRQAREDTWRDINTKVEEKEFDKDDKFRMKNEMQKIIDEASEELEAIVAKKENEILTQ